MADNLAGIAETLQRLQIATIGGLNAAYEGENEEKFEGYRLDIATVVTALELGMNADAAVAMRATIEHSLQQLSLLSLGKEVIGDDIFSPESAVDYRKSMAPVLDVAAHQEQEKILRTLSEELQRQQQGPAHAA